MPRDRRPRAARLLDEVIVQGVMRTEELSGELRVSAEVLRRFRAGELAMPLERQPYLAVLVRRHAPDAAVPHRFWSG